MKVLRANPSTSPGRLASRYTWRAGHRDVLEAGSVQQRVEAAADQGVTAGEALQSHLTGDACANPAAHLAER